jgi:hypothetical protein
MVNWLSVILAGCFGFCAAEAGSLLDSHHYGWALTLALFSLFFLVEMLRADLS